MLVRIFAVPSHHMLRRAWLEPPLLLLLLLLLLLPTPVANDDLEATVHVCTPLKVYISGHAHSQYI
jgi:hypothetical protein